MFSRAGSDDRERMRVGGSRLLQVPTDFEQRLSNNGKFTLTAESWHLAMGSDQLHLRMVKIDVPKATSSILGSSQRIRGIIQSSPQS